ncbi:unnamed protein product [Didymodactylos carnosus]|uniref:F-box domain-containing protein n=1 Tax=Didymodactylos carnosus TaxID=1234261 RepID=A0A815AKH3_9BILA|nr:unnamed protein product [Didymodactylos carnosus]CAF4033893.1 unnamed protein product [Didymodactylos carnosus]
MNKLSSSSALATQSIPKKCKTKNRCNKLSKSDDAPNHVLKKDLNKTSVHHNKLQKKQVKDIIRVCPNEKYYKTTATTKYVKSNEISTLESSLPNELYDFIFLYLKSRDIIYSFFNLNDHFNNLIYPFFCAIDLSNVDECTLSKYCQTILPKIHHHIKAIKVDHKNIDSVFPLWLYSKIYPNLESVFITQVEKDGKDLSYLKFFKQLLNLKIYFGEGEYNETVSNELCSNLFQSDCRLQTLFFDNVYVPINTHTIQRCFSIRKLTIKVHCLDNVYVLLNNLPSIESINISIAHRT